MVVWDARQFPEHARIHLMHLTGGVVVEERNETFECWLPVSVLQSDSVEPEATGATFFIEEDGLEWAFLVEEVRNERIEERMAGSEELDSLPACNLSVEGHAQAAGKGIVLQTMLLEELPGDTEAIDFGASVFAELPAHRLHRKSGEPFDIPGDKPLEQ